MWLSIEPRGRVLHLGIDSVRGHKCRLIWIWFLQIWGLYYKGTKLKILIGSKTLK